MIRFARVVSLTLFLLLSLGVGSSEARHSDTKTDIGMPFPYFEIGDIYNQSWVSTYLRGRPTVILTGRRHIRYEILKWAETLRREFGLPGMVHLLWVVNLRRTPWTTSRATIANQWRAFAPPIPLLLDWRGQIGRALYINYNVPNIIVIDSHGRLAMHQLHSFTPEVYNAVAMKIRSLLRMPPQIPGHPSPSFPKGSTGYSH